MRDLEASFRTFNENGGKFRVSVTNVCNMSCYFCHNEGQPPFATTRTRALDVDALVSIIDSYAALGGRQINLTGGEPLAAPELPEILARIEPGATRIVINTNGTLADRLLSKPRFAKVDTLLVSLHTVDNNVFRKTLGGRDVNVVMRNVLALGRHGYRVKLNLSLNPANQAGFKDVLGWSVANRVDLKVIALVRPNDDAAFYGGDWVDPASVVALVEPLARAKTTHDNLGGQTTLYQLDGHTVEVKNISRGRLRTDFCNGCTHEATCGEGIYGLRIGTDALWKPCLLRREAYRAADARPHRQQILELIDAMVGDWSRARFATGAPA